MMRVVRLGFVLQFGIERGSDLTEYRMLEDHSRGQRHPAVPGLCGHPHREDAISTEIEEIVVTPDLVRLQDLGQNGRQSLLCGGAGRVRSTCDWCSPSQRGRFGAGEQFQLAIIGPPAAFAVAV